MIAAPVWFSAGPWALCLRMKCLFFKHPLTSSNNSYRLIMSSISDFDLCSLYRSRGIPLGFEHGTSSSVKTIVVKLGDDSLVTYIGLRARERLHCRDHRVELFICTLFSISCPFLPIRYEVASKRLIAEILHRTCFHWGPPASNWSPSFPPCSLGVHNDDRSLATNVEHLSAPTMVKKNYMEWSVAEVPFAW